MTQVLSEDDVYRASTQYRLWSFSPSRLAAQRQKTHDIALQRARQYASKLDAKEEQNEPVEYLTETEELRLVQRYCNLIRTTSDHLGWPHDVKATAVQYLKRFYLSNSCMTYPPKDIYKTVLFLASKTEAIHSTVTKYAHRISAEPDAILAPEYKVMQALRFTLDVRHPTRGLKGVLVELLNMVAGRVGPVEAVETGSGEEIQERMRHIPPPPPEAKTQWQASPGASPMSEKQLADRVQLAYKAARDLLDAPACLTDIYFLYTPSQILLATLQLADEPLLDFYLDTKLPATSDARPRIFATIRACAADMGAFDAAAQIMSKDEARELEKKLERCRDPATQDLIEHHAAMKRNGGREGGGATVADQEAKRRKLERQQSGREMDDLFGPGLPGAKVNG